MKGEGHAIEIVCFCLLQDLVSAGEQVGYLGNVLGGEEFIFHVWISFSNSNKKAQIFRFGIHSIEISCFWKNFVLRGQIFQISLILSFGKHSQLYHRSAGLSSCFLKQFALFFKRDAAPYLLTQNAGIVQQYNNNLKYLLTRLKPHGIICDKLEIREKMDTSKEYIKMCYEAKELQDRDFVYFMTHPKEYVGEYNCEHGGVMTWLPRQDQLQEMIKFEPWEGQTTSLHRLFFKFREFVQNDDADTWWDFKGDFTSMEQLWLAFVMKEKYNKVWNNAQWIPS